MRAIPAIAALLALAPGFAPAARATNIHMVFLGQVTQRTDGEVTYSGTVKVRDFDAPADPFVAWMRQLRVEANGKLAALSDNPRPQLEGNFYVYDWSLKLPATTRVELLVKDAVNGHKFFGGRKVGLELPLLKIEAYDHYANCGDAGSTSAAPGRNVPASYVQERRQVENFDRVSARR